MTDKRRKNKTKITYAAGGFGKNLAYSLVSTYTLFYYNAVLELDAAFVGFLLMAARIFDAFNDPLMGVVVARTRSRYGRFKPWILIGAVTNCIVLCAMFNVPGGMNEASLKVYVAVTYVLCGITYTLGDIPYMSIIPAFTKAGPYRESITVYSRTLSGIGAALPTILGVAFVEILGNGDHQKGFTYLAVITAAVYLLTTVIMIRFLPEDRIHDDAAAEDMPTVKELMLSLIRNRHAMHVAAVIILFSTSITMVINLAVYLFQYDVQDDAQYTVFMVISGITQLAAMVAVYPALRKRMSNRKVFIFGCLCTVAGFVTMLPIIGARALSIRYFIIPVIGVSIGNGIEYVLTTIFIAGAVDYGEKMTGRRDESTTSSLQTFIIKMSSALAVFLAGAGLDLIRFNEDVLVQSPYTITGLRILFVVPPMILMLLSFLIFLKNRDLGEDIIQPE